jgi:hypothetical protein
MRNGGFWLQVSFPLSLSVERNTMELQQKDLRDFKKAKTLLENPGIAAKITNLIGTPIEKEFELLPYNWNARIGEITQAALTKATQEEHRDQVFILDRLR